MQWSEEWPIWVGIDVGARRKGFHAVGIDRQRRLGQDTFAGPGAVDAAVDWVVGREPALVGIDAPRRWAAAGERSRACEREFRQAGVCSIRYTPNEAAARRRRDSYYEWIEHGLELYEALGEVVGSERVIECYPTASWTRWVGPREQSRARWTVDAMARVTQGLVDTSSIRNQDQRDALAAALTALQCDLAPGWVESWGELWVPTPGHSALQDRLRWKPAPSARRWVERCE